MYSIPYYNVPRTSYNVVLLYEYLVDIDSALDMNYCGVCTIS